MDKVHILDGNNFFSRVYFAGGRTLSAILNQFLKMRQRYKGRFIVTFDTTKSARRLSIYPEYKAGRKSSLTPEQYEEFKATLNAFMAVLQNMKITVMEGNGYEADDYIAMLCVMLKRFHVFIHSTDQDFFQLVSDRVTFAKPNGDGEVDLITPENFVEYVGVNQTFFIDYKSMVGDKSDNIDGIDGIGPGTASKYVNMYGSYQDIVNSLKPKLSETKKSLMPTATELKFLNGEESFQLAKKLIDLSLVYVDQELKNLVREKVGNTKLDMDAILEILTNNDSEEMFDVLRIVCKKN